jgi:putative transposase
MMFPLVLDLAADSIAVAVTCRVLGFSTQAFSQWHSRPRQPARLDDAQLINAAVDLHHDDPEFGYRFITDELAGHGITASRNRVNRLCTQQRIFSTTPASAAAAERRDRRSTTIWSSGRSPRPHRTGCG